MTETPTIDSRPRPDPTLLTTAQLHREMEWMKSMINGHIEAERDNLSERKDLFMKLFTTGDLLINQRIDGVLREIQLIGDANKVAVAKSEAGYEKRFEAMNEFRGQMADQATHFISSAESKAMYNATQEKLSDLSDRMTRNEGRGAGAGEGRNELKGNIIGVLGVLVALATLFMFLTNLSSKVDQNTRDRITRVEATAK